MGQAVARLPDPLAAGGRHCSPDFPRQSLYLPNSCRRVFLAGVCDGDGSDHPTSLASFAAFGCDHRRRPSSHALPYTKANANSLPYANINAISYTKTPSPTPKPRTKSIPHVGGAPLDSAEIEKWIIEFTNRERIAVGLSPFTHDLAISDISRQHSENMGKTRIYAHEINEDGPTDRALAAGYGCWAWPGLACPSTSTCIIGC